MTEVSRQGNVGLVPGGAGGIGRATGVTLPGAGACVLVSDLATLGPAELRYFGCPASDDMGEILPKGSRIAVPKFRSLARRNS